MSPNTNKTRLLPALAAALAFCLPASANIVVDNLDDGNSKNVFDQYWYTYSTYTSGMTLTPSGDFSPTAGGANGSAYAASITFDGLGGGASGEYPEIAIGTPLTASETAGYGGDFNSVDSISFYAKGPGGLKFYFNVHTEENAPNGNDNKYGKLIAIAAADANAWKKYSFGLKPVVAPTNVGQNIGATPSGRAGDLTQAPNYGKAYTFDPAKVTRLSWAIKKADNTTGTTTSPASGTFAVDEVTLIGAITAPVPPVITKYALTYKVNDERYGCVSVNNTCYFEKTDSVAAGASGPTVTAKPYDFYRFVKWDDDYADAARSDPATGDKVFTAIFERRPSITYKAGDGGDLQIEGEPGLKKEHSVTLAVGQKGPTVTAVGQFDPPRQFKKWSDGLTTPSRSDNGIDGNLTFTAEFEESVAPPAIDYKKITYAAGEGGLLNIIDSRRPGSATVVLVPAYADSLAPGDSVSATAVPNEGYTFFQWSDNVATVTRTDRYAGGDVRADAIFAAVPTDPASQYFTLAYSAGIGGKLKEGNGNPAALPVTRSVAAGSVGPTVAAVPDDGYEFVKWSDGKTNALRADTAKANLLLTAEFAQIDAENKKFTISYTAGEGGKLSVDYNYSDLVARYDTTVAAGGNAAVVAAVADAGYVFVKWSDGSTDPQRLDESVQANISAAAEFKLKDPDIAVAAPDREIPAAPNAEITALAPIVVTAGGFTAGPNPAAAEINFFRTGRALKNGKLSVYDASGALVATIPVRDGGSGAKRAVASWNLTDAKGRPVATGTYAVKGAVATKTGAKEKFSATIAVTR